MESTFTVASIFPNLEEFPPLVHNNGFGNETDYEGGVLNDKAIRSILESVGSSIHKNP